MSYKKKLVRAFLNPKKKITKIIDTSDIEDDDKKYKSDPVLDEPDNSDPLPPNKRYKEDKSRNIENTALIMSSLERDRMLSPQIQMQQIQNRNIQNQLQNQFLQAQMMQNQLQNQQQTQTQSQISNIFNVQKNPSRLHEILEKADVNHSRNFGLKDSEVDELIGMVEDPYAYEKIIKKLPGLQYIITDAITRRARLNEDHHRHTEERKSPSRLGPVKLFGESTDSSGLIDERAINSLHGVLDSDYAMDPLLTRPDKYNNQNTWYINALKQHNNLTNKLKNADAREYDQLSEVLDDLDSKIGAYKISAGLKPNIFELKEFKELLKYIKPMYHSKLNHSIEKLIDKSTTKEEFLNDKWVRQIIKNGSIDSVKSGFSFGNLWNTVKNWGVNTWNRIKDVGENIFRTIDSNPEILKTADTIANTIIPNAEPNVASRYYTRAQDYFSRYPRFSRGLTSMGINSITAGNIIKDVHNGDSISKVLKSYGINSSGINKALLSNGLIKDKLDLNIPREEIETTLKKKHKLSKINKLINKIIKLQKTKTPDFKLILSKGLNESNEFITNEEFLKLPEVVELLEDSADPTKSSGFFDGLFNAFKNLPRNLLSFVAKGAPIIDKITNALGPISSVIPVVGTVSEIVNKGFQTANALNQKITGRGIDEIIINPDSKKKLRKIAKF